MRRNRLFCASHAVYGVTMSIFDFTQTPPALSRDWKVFQQFVGNIGAFTYIAKEKAAYLDTAACHMLGCPSEKINEFEFFNLLEMISKNPVEGQKHIYKYTDGNVTRYIKMNIYEVTSGWESSRTSPVRYRNSTTDRLL